MKTLLINKFFKEVFEHLGIDKHIPSGALKTINTLVNCEHYSWVFEDGSVYIENFGVFDAEDIFSGKDYSGFLCQLDNDIIAIYLLRNDKKGHQL